MKARLAAALVLACPAGALAADLPQEFSGVWIAVVGEYSQCSKSSEPGERSMTIEPGKILYWEARCEILAVRMPKKPVSPRVLNVEADLACSGAGSRWDEVEIWHLRTVDGRKMIAATTVQTIRRDRRGRRLPPDNDPVTRMYLECQ